MARKKKALAPPVDIAAMAPTPSYEFDHTGKLRGGGGLAPDSPETAGDVDVISPEGRLGSVPRAQLQTALENKYRVPTHEDYKNFELEKSLDADPLAKAGAFATGALSTASLGASDAAIVGAYGEEGRQALKGLKESEATGGYNTAGQFAGMFLPGNPAGLVGKGMGLGAASIVGREASSLLGRGLRRGLAGAVAGGAEMALFEAGAQVNEDILGGHDVTGEKLMHALGRGFYTGAPVGAAFGAGSALIEKAGLNVLGRIGEKADDLAVTARNRQLGVRIGDLRKSGRTAEEIAEMEARNARIAEEVQTADGRTLAGAKDFEEASNIANELRTTAVDDIAGGYRAADAKKLKFDADAFYKEVEASGVFDRVSTLKPTQVMVPRAPGATGPAAMPQTVMKRVPIAGREADFAEAMGYFENLKRDLGGTSTFTDAWERRKVLYDLVNWEKQKVTPAGQQILKQLGGMFEGHLSSQLEAKLGPLDAAALAKHKTGKEIYGALKDMQEWSTREFARSESASNIRARDYMGGGTGAYMGSRAGGAIAGPAGAAVGAGLGGIAGGIANRFVNEHASRHIADFSRKASKLKVLGDKTAQFTKDVERRIQDFVDGTRSVTTKVAVAAKHRREDYPKLYEHIQAMANNPDAVAERVGQVIHPDLRKEAPNVVTAMVGKAIQDYQFLASVAPKMPAPGNYLQPTLGRGRLPNDTQLMKFFRYLDAMDETPIKVLDLAMKGRLHREAVHVMKVTSPHMYEFVRAGIMDAVGRSRKRLTTQQKSAMRIIYGLAVDSTQEREFVQFCQQAYSPEFVAEANVGTNDNPGQQSGSAPKRPLQDAAEDYRTAVDQLMA